MLAEVGYLATLFAFVAALYAIVVSIYGNYIESDGAVRSGRNAALFAFVMLFVATGMLEYALITEHYEIAYIWSVSSPDMPMFYRVTAIWGSQAGSLLFWCFLMSGFAAGAIAVNWRSHRKLMPHAIAYMMASLAFFLYLVLFIENPFERYWIDNVEGIITSTFMPSGAVEPTNSNMFAYGYNTLANTARGLSPMLRHFGMVYHPPMLYLGFVGFIIPYSFAMAALASGDLSNSWIKATRFWGLIAWLFLSLGLLLGGRWAYDVLGWGGYWGWDPVENAAFLPWLTGTAFVHSIIIQDKRGMFKTWNMFLVIGTFSAVIFGTFATRSGLVDSVHSFAQSGIGMPMFAYWSGMTIISVILILWRKQRGELDSEHQLNSLFSREALFIVNNFIFLALFIAVFWGSFGAPIISELFMDTDITLGVDYFMQVTPPLFGLLFLLMGVAPLSAWGTTSLSKLGRSIIVPVMLTVAVLLVISADWLNRWMDQLPQPLWEMSGENILEEVRSIEKSRVVALTGYGLALLAGFVVLYETFRGAASRRKRFDENWFEAVAKMARRNPRRYGGYMVHLGITIIGIGVIGSTLFQAETQKVLSVGDSLTVQDYEMRYDNLLRNQIADDGRRMDIAEVTVIRDGKEIAHLRPRVDSFPTSAERMTIAGAHSTLENDFYVLLVSWDPLGKNEATFKVFINPLINLVWGGGLILVLGTLIAVWPQATGTSRRKQQPTLAKKVGASA